VFTVIYYYPLNTKRKIRSPRNHLRSKISPRISSENHWRRRFIKGRKRKIDVGS